MCDSASKSPQVTNWNVLTSRWIEVMSLHADVGVYSPLEALEHASEIQCISLASPLDLFAAHRFLLTLLYWKEDSAGGAKSIRQSLLRGRTPRHMLDAIGAEAHRFRLFDDEAPFLQDPSARDDKNRKSAGSFFAECASGTNIALFHHGDDTNMRLCVRCATIGMLRVVPWSQSGGAGLTPSVHGAPPIMALAFGENLAVTLGLNLVPLSVNAGTAKWTGHFAPTNKQTEIPYLEALTWNPRRVHLRSPETAGVCWRCGQTGVVGVGPIVYLKNERTTKRSDRKPFEWQDPAAFYDADAPYTTNKSSDKTDGRVASGGRDLERLLDEEAAPSSAVVAANPDHIGWRLIIPCTNPANNKSFDHRQLELKRLTPDVIRSALPARAPAGPKGLDGWAEPRRLAHAEGAAAFVHAAVRLLSPADWAILAAAAYREMHDSPAAFDLLSGLLWPLRRRVTGLPTRNVAWLILKLMAAVPSLSRAPHADATFCPLRLLPKRQSDRRRDQWGVASHYPVAFPRGRRLEAELRRSLDGSMRRRPPERTDWAGLCRRLDGLLD